MTKLATPTLSLKKLSANQLRETKKHLESFFYKVGVNICFYKASKDDRLKQFNVLSANVIREQLRRTLKSGDFFSIAKSKQPSLQIKNKWLSFDQLFPGGKKAMFNFLVWAGEEGGSAAFYKLGVSNEKFTLNNESLKNILRKHVDSMIRAIDDATVYWITNILTVGTRKGASINTMVEMMFEKLDSVSSERAEFIADTEFIYASSLVELEVYKKNKVEKIRWKACEDEKGEENCIKNENGGSIKIDESFPSGEKMPPASAMCRCFLMPVSKIDKVFWKGD